MPHYTDKEVQHLQLILNGLVEHMRLMQDVILAISASLPSEKSSADTSPVDHGDTSIYDASRAKEVEFPPKNAAASNVVHISFKKSRKKPK